MNRTLLEMYALAVCFVTAVCFAVVLGIGIYDAVQISNPAFTLNSYAYERHQSNEAFMKSSSCSGYAPEGAPEEKAPGEKTPEAEITKKRLDSYRAELRAERRKATQSLAVVIIILIIDAALFVVHWRLARNARLASAEAGR